MDPDYLPPSGKVKWLSARLPAKLRQRRKMVVVIIGAVVAALLATALYLKSVEREVDVLYQQTALMSPTAAQPISAVRASREPAADKSQSENECDSPPAATWSPSYSAVQCKDLGSSTFVGLGGVYGFPIVNRSCVYENVSFDPSINKFIFYLENTPMNRALVKEKQVAPVVNLASRPYDLPIRHQKRLIVKKKVGWTFEYTPEFRLGPIPHCLKHDERSIGYYTPIVAPWNFAHTLFCDLFALFWIMFEFGLTHLVDVQVVATSSHFLGDFALPNKNKAFDFFSQRPPMYDVHLPKAVYRRLIVGSGTKSWSWVTGEYSASGNSKLWQAFRSHAIAVTGATDRYKNSTNATGGDAQPIRVSICHKKDKRGVVNYDETLQVLQKAFPNEEEIQFVLEGAVGKSAREQVQMMINADVYMCNEGTLATAFMFMPPGSVFLSLPLVYHTPHLHQRKMPDPATWWSMPDMLRPDPRKNTGGNIDWFPPSIRWIKTMWYHRVPLNETRIQLPLMHLRNYMPEMNIVIEEKRIVALFARVLRFLKAKEKGVWTVGESSGEIEVLRDGELEEDDCGPRPPNYSVNADLCRQMLQLDPNMTRAFNSARCYFGMSWLCEFWTNTKLKWRILHEKWSLSKGRCGGRSTAIEHLPELTDPRVAARPLSEYLFYSKEDLLHSYTTLDLGNFTVSSKDVADIFPITPAEG